MPEQRSDTPQIRALALLGEQFDLAIERVEAAESAATAGIARPKRTRGWSVLLPQRRVARAALATAMACVVGLIVYALALDTGHTPSPQEALADVAAVARLQPMPAEDEFTYTRALVVKRLVPVEPIGTEASEDAPDKPVLITSERRSWVSIARPGLVIDHAVSVRAADPDAVVDPDLSKSALAEPTRFTHPRLARYRFGARNYTRAEIVKLPSNPRAIVRRLRAELQNADPETRDAELWQSITQTLTRSTAPLPPELRAGLIDSLALVPGVRVEESYETPSGRTGRAFTLDSGGVEQRIVFDTETADVLLTETTVATREAARGFNQPVGSLLDRYELVETAIVDEIPAEVLSEE